MFMQARIPSSWTMRLNQDGNALARSGNSELIKVLSHQNLGMLTLVGCIIAHTNDLISSRLTDKWVTFQTTRLNLAELDY